VLVRERGEVAMTGSQLAADTGICAGSNRRGLLARGNETGGKANARGTSYKGNSVVQGLAKGGA